MTNNSARFLPVTKTRDDESGESRKVLSLDEAQQTVDAWIQTTGVRYFSELTNLAQLMEEVGELARLVSRIHGEQSFKPGESPERVPDEMADIMFVLICLANQMGVNLNDALLQNLDKKTRRDGDRHRNNPKLKPSAENPS
jgi:NTP pyrophosphatase (non-canonical NTP hydrolase)